MEPQTFSTTDVDEANAISREFFYKSRVEPVPSATLSFRYGLTVSSTGSMTFGILTHACEVEGRSRGIQKTYGLSIPLRGSFPFKYGKQTIVANPSTAALRTPTTEMNFRGFPSGTEQLFLLALDRGALDSQLRKISGRDNTKTIEFEPSMDIRQGKGAQWWQMASVLVLSLRSPNTLIGNPLITAQLSEAVMTGLLLAADHPYREDLDAWARPMPPNAIRKAKAIIETRAHEALTIPDIAVEVGCSLRTLQTGYRTHYDMTPHEHLVRVRLDRAHSLLRAANPATAGVAEIAALCGFGHPGRFASAYRKVYGVAPSITLRDG